jgi:hypothetical protein
MIETEFDSEQSSSSFHGGKESSGKEVPSSRISLLTAEESIRAFFAAADVEEMNHIDLYFDQLARKNIFNIFMLREYCRKEDGTFDVNKLLDMDFLEIHAEDMIRLMEDPKTTHFHRRGNFEGTVEELLKSLDIFPADTISQQISLKVGIKSAKKLVEKQPWKLLEAKVTVFQEYPILLSLLRSEVEAYSKYMLSVSKLFF